MERFAIPRQEAARLGFAFGLGFWLAGMFWLGVVGWLVWCLPVLF